MVNLLVISLRIAPAAEAAFTEFYHHHYIPKLLEVVPEITTARRYEEYGVAGSLKWFSKRLLTFYELAPNVSLEQINSALSRPGREEETATWQHWKVNALQGLSRVAYQQTYAHSRCPWDGIFGNRPFFQVSVEVKPEAEPEFRAWYEESYLPKIMADVPTWAACRRYTSLDREPVIYHTIYETANLADLETSFASMRSAYRYGSNADWDRWVGTAITYQDAASYRPIFRRPG
ncbi:hypothetical protein [Synechocystis sp. CACIAM 05]|uniref:hypothetical protein n=1 Tax=Synechocystis sp. CACIAM 05 TaxID=1933929 RepID=UPI00138E5971|nr:hypothetical protein [Synechocystis sp. CACIAM 05]QHV00705.1 hypothetical protein BWK47_11620 [Synechocystis sp. CACIAM 05]